MRPSPLALVLTLLVAFAAACGGGSGVTTTTTTVVDSTTTTSEALPPVTGVTTTVPTSVPTTVQSTTTTTTTTTISATTTGVTAPPGNRPPDAEILSPRHLSSHKASYYPSTGRYGAAVTLEGVASDPDGDAITVAWYSSDDGYLGNTVTLSTVLWIEGSDSSQPFISLRVTDKWGRQTEDTIQVIVWIPSDT